MEESFFRVRIIIILSNLQNPTLFILQPAIRSSHINTLSQLHPLQKHGQLASARKLWMNIRKINLDNEIYMTFVSLITRNRRITSNNQFPINFRTQINVFAGSKA